MKSAEDIRKFFQKSTLSTNPERHEAVFEKIQRVHDQSKTTPALSGFNLRSKIMKNPIVKLAAVAVIAIAAIIYISQFGGSGTSVAWGEVAEKMQASRGLIYRENHLNETDEAIYFMYYDSPTHGRTDFYKQGQIVRSIYSNYSTRDFLVIQYDDKCYFNHPMDEKDIQDHQRQMHLNDWAEVILSRQHINLGQRAIEGVLCEGIETEYAIFGDANSPVEDSAHRIWVNVKTGYPVLCEVGTLGNDGKLQVEIVLDQFQWDIDLDANVFEPDIPSDYEQM